MVGERSGYNKEGGEGLIAREDEGDEEEIWAVEGGNGTGR